MVEKGNSYTTYLPTYYNLTAEYKLTNRLTAKGLIGIVDRHNQKGLGYEFALTTHWQAKSWFATALSLSKRSYQSSCLGSYLLIGKGFQCVLGSDNILGFLGANFSPNLYLGCNIRL